LTWANIRNRIVKQIGETAMTAVEKGVEIFQIVREQGVGGLWQLLLDKLGDIKEMILEQVKDFVVTKIITAGITWLIGLLNPAAAFIKACKLIYDIVMFFVNNAARIMKFVNTVIDSVSDIVHGNIGGVVAKIESVLGQMVPILIGFLASAIGLGGIGEKIREIISTLQKPVTKAIDFVIKTGLKLAGPIIRGLKGFGGKVKAGAKKLTAAVKKKLGIKAKTPEQIARDKQDRLDKGVAAGVAAANRFAGKPVGSAILRPLLAAIRLRYRMQVLEPVLLGQKWGVHGTVNPEKTEPSSALGTTPMDEAKRSKGERFLVKAAHRIARVTGFSEHGFVFLTFDRERGIGGTSKTREGRPSFPVQEFLDNIKNGGPSLIKATGTTSQTAYTLDGKTLRPEYHAIRRMFYLGDYRVHLPEKLRAAAAPSPGMFRCPGYQHSAHEAPIASATLDHRFSVAAHWNATGHKSGNAERTRFWTDPSNLDVLCGPCNSRKSSRDPDGNTARYIKEVAIPGFTGPDGKS
ncbi:MAG: hypothetical protein WAQ75_03860, partial [Propionicimonas sp.]